MSSQPATYWMELADGRWLSYDEKGRIVALDMPGAGEASFEMLRDAISEADADLERRKRRQAKDDPRGPHDGSGMG